MTMNVLERVQRAIDRLQHRSRPAYSRIGPGNGNAADLPTSSSDTTAIAATASNIDACSSPSPVSSTASTPTGRRHSNRLPTTSSSSSLVMMMSSSGRRHRRCFRRPRSSSGGGVRRQTSYCDNDVEFDDPDDDEYFYDDGNGFVTLLSQPLGGFASSPSCDVFDVDSCNSGSANTMIRRGFYSTTSFDENDQSSPPLSTSSSLPRSANIAARRKTASCVDGGSHGSAINGGTSGCTVADGCSPTSECRRVCRAGSLFDWRQVTKTASTRTAAVDDTGRRSSSVVNGGRTTYGSEPTSNSSPPLTPRSPFHGLRSPISGRRLSGPSSSAVTTTAKSDCLDDASVDAASTGAARWLPAVVDGGCWSCPASPRVDCNGRNLSPLPSHACVGRGRRTPPLGDRRVQRRREPCTGPTLDSGSPSPDRSAGRGKLSQPLTPNSSLSGGGTSRSSPLHNPDGRVGPLPPSTTSSAAAAAAEEEEEEDYDNDLGSGKNRVSVTSQRFLTAADGDVYVSRDHAATILRKMATLYESRQLCDVVLVAGEYRILAHKLVLGSASDYFAAAFADDDRLSGDGSFVAADVELDNCNADIIDTDDAFVVEKMNTPRLRATELHISSDVDPAIMAEVIAYIYTGRLILQRQSIEPILSLATMWRLDDVVRACCGYLGDNIRPSTCIGLLNFAAINDCRSLYSSTYQYIVDNFAEVVATPGGEFRHQLSAEDLVALLSRDDLNVPDERTVYRAAVAWLRHDVARRRQHAVDLLVNVRLPLLSPQFITDHVTSDRLLMDDKRCQEIVLEAVRYHLLPERRHFLHSLRTRPRKSTVGRLVVAGGGPANPDSSLTAITGDSMNVEIYDPRTDKWSSVVLTSSRVTSWPPPHPAATVGSRQQYGVAVDDRSVLYIVGGRDGLKTLNAVNAFDLRTGRWSVEQGLATPRHGLGVVVLGGPMYAVGGHDGWSYLNNVERWDPETRRWAYVAPMPTARSTLGVVAIDNKLLAIGGRDGGACLAVVERYSPHTDSWSTCAPLNRRRAGVSAAECNGFVYAVGGHDCSSGPSATTGSPAVAATGGSKKTVATTAAMATAVLLDCVER